MTVRRKTPDRGKNKGLIEKYGSGIQRIIEQFKKTNLPKPVFKNISGGFMVTVFAGLVTKNDTLNEREKKILQMIKKDRYITQEEMAKHCKVSIETVKRDIKKLQMMNVIQRVGSKKTGHSKITELIQPKQE